MRKIAVVCGITSIFFLSVAVFAYTLNPIVITASRIADSLLDTPATVDVITAEELKDTGAKTVAEALQFVAGLELYNNGPSGMDSWVSIRGVSREVLVMIDGVPVNNPQGESANFSFNLGLIPLEDVRRIEIIKGASSALYGDAAFGGVINIITKKGSKQPHVYAGTTRGGNGFYNYTLHLSGIQGKFRYFLYGGRSSIGKVEDYHRYMPWGETSYKYDDFLSSETRFVSARIGYGDWSFFYLYSNLVPEYEANGYYNKIDDKACFYHLSYNGFPWKFTLYYHKYDKDYWTDSPYYKPYYHHVNEIKGLDLYRKFAISDRNVLVLGVNLQKEEIDSTSDNSHARTSKSIYFEDRFKIGDFDFSVGGRYEKITQSDAKDYTEFLPRMGISKEVSKGCRWFLNVGKAFKLPTFDDLYFDDPWTPGNPNLEPEKGWTYEMGFKGLKKGLEYRISFFYQSLSDYIAWAPEKDNPWIWTPSNVEDFRMKGVELAFRQKINENFNWYLNLDFEQAEDRGNPVAAQSDKWYKCGIPAFQGKFGLVYHKDGFSLGLNYSYVGERKFEDQWKPYTLGSYGVLNLSLRNRFNGGLVISVDVLNLFDNRYEVRKDYFSEGRRIYLSVGYEF